MCDVPEIPAFLKLSTTDRSEAWRKNPPKRMPAFKEPVKDEDPTTAALRKQIEADEKAATTARLASVREKYGKRAG